jgi:hypothetical protein
MTGPVPDDLSSGSVKWHNWHESVEQKVAELVAPGNADPNHSTLAHYNAMTAHLQGWIGKAQQRGVALRAYGGGWSLSSVAVTDGILLNTRSLNYNFRFRPDQLHSACPIAPDNLILAQCGMTIGQLNDFLGTIGKSLKTSGASNGQTIAGAAATGTHGSAIDVGAIQDGVRGLHIVTAADAHVWLEPASQPALADAVIAGMGAQLRRDDALFNAALVNLGSFGLVHGVLLEVEDLYHLWTMRKQVPDGAPLRAAIERLDFSGLALPRPGVRPHHFQTVTNPHDASNVFVSVMYKDKTPDATCQPIPPGSKFRQGDDAMEVIGFITKLFPGISGPLAAPLLAKGLPPFEGQCGTHGEIFNLTTTRGKSAGSALGIPLARVGEAYQIAVKTTREAKFAGLISLRYVPASRATLAFTFHAPHTCILDLDAPNSSKTQQVFRKVWKAFDDAGVPYTMHWGKMNGLDAAQVIRAYGQPRVDAWLAARRTLLPTAALRNTFANAFLRGVGLAETT